jgi:hypothetical protein
MGYDFYRRDNLREPRSCSEDAYFRASNEAFGAIYEVMSVLGILDVSMEAPEPSGGSEESRTGRSAEPGAIPAYKFLSNDSWIVVPEECEAIAAALERVVSDTRGHLQPSPGEQIGLDLFERFARFNRKAAAHGGYIVT